MPTLKEGWHLFRASRPGRRFQDRYERRHRPDRHKLMRVACVGGGALLIPAGLLLLPMPGPGILVLALAAALIAQESLPVSRHLDALEVKLRGWAARLRRVRH